MDHPEGFKPSSVLVISVLSLFLLGVFVAAYIINKRSAVTRSYDTSYAQQVIEMDTLNEVNNLDETTIVDTSSLLRSSDVF